VSTAATAGHDDGRDARMTADRDELKYVLPAAAAVEVAREIASRWPRHRFQGPDANTLPEARHHVTTVYFDTPGRDVYRAAAASDDNVKLRAKEYYDLHPDLTELATDPRDLVRYSPLLWLELKQRQGNRTRKHRIGIPKREVPTFFASGVVTPEMLRIQKEANGAGAERAIEELQEFCARFEEPLRADSMVSYRRTAWQDDEGMLRVTIDRSLSYFAPPADLWTRTYALVRETLGEPRTSFGDCVVEVKMRGEPPAWLPEVLKRSGARQERYSKFLSASRAVHG
jgi:hypothetical protein